jgi:hypothetical protein
MGKKNSGVTFLMGFALVIGTIIWLLVEHPLIFLLVVVPIASVVITSVIKWLKK